MTAFTFGTLTFLAALALVVLISMCGVVVPAGADEMAPASCAVTW